MGPFLESEALLLRWFRKNSEGKYQPWTIAKAQEGKQLMRTRPRAGFGSGSADFRVLYSVLLYFGPFEISDCWISDLITKNKATKYKTTNYDELLTTDEPQRPYFSSRPLYCSNFR